MLTIPFLRHLKSSGINFAIVAIKEDDSDIYHAKYFIHPPAEDEIIRMEIEMMTNPDLSHISHLVINQDYVIKFCSIDQLIALFIKYDAENKKDNNQ